MIKIEEINCVGCAACVQRCPKQCIAMSPDGQGFLCPEVDTTLCIDCGLCERVCPSLASLAPRKPEAAFAARNRSDSIRAQSSSGGIFQILAAEVIGRGGVVFGARFAGDFSVEHSYVETLEELAAFRGSKYLQSRIGSAYADAERFLKAGRQVLFTGTPCQIAGLKQYLRKDYDGLLAVDVVCHGVPSPLVWQSYLTKLCADHGLSTARPLPIAGVKFRDKRIAWDRYGVCIDLHRPDGSKEEIFEPLSDNMYMRIFLNDLALRPSCFDCPAKSGRSGADLTLGDFWGVKRSMPEFYDSKGISAILVHTDKGAAAIASPDIDKAAARYADVLRGNPSIEVSARRPKLYAAFWTAFGSSGLDQMPALLKKMEPSAAVKAYRWCKRKVKGLIKLLIGRR